MLNPLSQLLPKLLGAHEDQVVCPVCRGSLSGGPTIRLRGMILHRDCLGYQGRQLLRTHGHRRR